MFPSFPFSLNHNLSGILAVRILQAAGTYRRAVNRLERLAIGISDMPAFVITPDRFRDNHEMLCLPGSLVILCIRNNVARMCFGFPTCLMVRIDTLCGTDFQFVEVLITFLLAVCLCVL